MKTPRLKEIKKNKNPKTLPSIKQLVSRSKLLGRNVMTKPDSMLKSRDISLLIKDCIVKAMVFPGVTYCCESWTVKKVESQRIDAFELFSSVQFSSVAQSWLTLCSPMNYSTPGFPVYHQLSELTQTHVYRLGDAIQPSQPLWSPSPPAFNPSQHQGLFQFFVWGGQRTGVSASASVLPMNSQDWSPLGWTGWISLQSKGLSRVFSNTTVQKHQFFCTWLSLQSNSQIHTWLLEKP